MQITKYNHACLVVENAGKVVLIDPGVYSEQFADQLLGNLHDLEAILITHEHADHCSPHLIKKIKDKFPHVTIISNETVSTLLKKEGFEVSTKTPPYVHSETILHEKIWLGSPCENTVFTVFNRLTHPGDSLHFQSSSEILALPITAPWGSTTEAVEKALELKPTTIIPIHDWLWKDEIREQFYQRLADYFAQRQINFIPVKNGETIEV
ncbi:MAG TPA: MBL fold metallo-hydrolase [Patescibacteria group bacterium]|nr:MBL fold metallo-hydrolase [Patescibacteria group bacterium]